MGIYASVVCVDCREEAPDVGRNGHIGYPSLDDADHVRAYFASFEYIYKGFAAIDALPLELEAFRAFLVTHQHHHVGLFYDGVEYDDTAPLGAPTEPDTKDRQFVFDDRGFVDAFYQITCDTCRAIWCAQYPQLLRNRDRRVLGADQIDAFLVRVVGIERRGSNFHKVRGLLDRRADGGMRAFVLDHSSHQLTVETIVEQRWLAPGRPSSPTVNVGSPPAPLSVKWTFEGARAYGHPVVAADGLLYATTANSEGLLCLSPQGVLLWRRDLGGRGDWGGGNAIVSVGTDVYYVPWVTALCDRRLFIFERDTGRLRDRVAFPFDTLESLGNGRAIARTVYCEPPERRLALFDMADLARPIWCHAFTPADRFDSSFAGLTVVRDRVLTTWGSDLAALRLTDGGIIWRRSLEGFDHRRPSGRPAVAASGDALLLEAHATLSAFDVKTGDLLWRRSDWRDLPWTLGDGVGYYTKARRASELAPLSGAVIAMTLATGEDVARAEAQAGDFAPAPPPAPIFLKAPAIGSTHVFAVESGRLWAFDQTELRPMWMVRPPGLRGGSTPIVVGDTLVVKGSDGLLFCFG